MENHGLNNFLGIGFDGKEVKREKGMMKVGFCITLTACGSIKLIVRGGKVIVPTWFNQVQTSKVIL